VVIGRSTSTSDGGESRLTITTAGAGSDGRPAREEQEATERRRDRPESARGARINVNIA
jgi:hypothetical protein